MGRDQPFDNISTRTRSPRERRGIVVDDNNVPGSNNKRGGQGKGGSQTRNSAKKDATPDTAMISLEPKKSSGLKARKVGLNLDEECMDLKMDQKQQPNNPPVLANESPFGQKTSRRKRGRPRKVLVSDLNNAVTAQNENVAKEEIVVDDSMTCDVDSRVPYDPMLVKGIEGDTPAKDSLSPYSHCKKLTECPSNQKNVSTDTINTASAKLSVSKGEGLNRQHERQISKRANRRAPSAEENSQTQDTTMVKISESICIAKEAKMGFKRGCKMLDDQPLSKWFEEMQSAGSSVVAKQHTESMKDKEQTKETPDSDNNEGAIIVSPARALPEPEHPFVRNTSLWAVVESMEVFLKMPQKPHFRPLLSHKYSSREGFAIACMVNFSSAVENISRLQFDDPKEKIDDILDSLNDLETHGFSVQVLRDRISDLLSVKESHDKLLAEVDDINHQVSLSDLEKSEQDKGINELKEQIEKLEEKIAKAKSIKEMKDAEIAALVSRRQDIEDTIRKSRSFYEELAAAL